MEEARSPLVAWVSFYVIVGSSGGALTGLQFVVIALIAEARRQSTAQEVSAFGTPTVVHFCSVLLMSAILSAPWQGLSKVALTLSACGLAGVVYCLIVVRRARRQAGYHPVFSDWLCHAVLPLIAYALLLIASISLPVYPQRALFVIGAMSLLLLFIGIRNAWDTVTYVAVGAFQKLREPPREP
jgi:hypothetical protein